METYSNVYPNHHLPASSLLDLSAVDEDRIKATQISFFLEKRAGCYFAAVAAKEPALYGWHQEIVEPVTGAIDDAIELGVATPSVSTLSLIFPSVQTTGQLLDLCRQLRRSGSIHLGLRQPFDDFLCLGYRAVVGDKQSWVTGFGPFEFLPVTRRSPYCELTMRVKPRPDYKKVMKKAPEGVLHLADLDMLGIAEAAFKTLWRSSLQRTAELLGHPPDLRSAAKTTYALPFELLTP